MKAVYESLLGLEVSKGNWDGAQWTITGNIKREHQPRPFDSAYDFEEWVKKNIRCSTIDFDSESCQFFAYAKSKQRAISFVKSIEKKFEKIKKIVG